MRFHNIPLSFLVYHSLMRIYIKRIVTVEGRHFYEMDVAGDMNCLFNMYGTWIVLNICFNSPDWLPERSFKILLDSLRAKIDRIEARKQRYQYDRPLAQALREIIQFIQTPNLTREKFVDHIKQFVQRNDSAFLTAWHYALSPALRKIVAEEITQDPRWRGQEQEIEKLKQDNTETVTDYCSSIATLLREKADEKEGSFERVWNDFQDSRMKSSDICERAAHSAKVVQESYGPKYVHLFKPDPHGIVMLTDKNSDPPHWLLLLPVDRPPSVQQKLWLFKTFGSAQISLTPKLLTLLGLHEISIEDLCTDRYSAITQALLREKLKDKTPLEKLQLLESTYTKVIAAQRSQSKPYSRQDDDGAWLSFLDRRQDIVMTETLRTHLKWVKQAYLDAVAEAIAQQGSALEDIKRTAYESQLLAFKRSYYARVVNSPRPTQSQVELAKILDPSLCFWTSEKIGIPTGLTLFCVGLCTLLAYKGALTVVVDALLLTSLGVAAGTVFGLLIAVALTLLYWGIAWLCHPSAQVIVDRARPLPKVQPERIDIHDSTKNGLIVHEQPSTKNCSGLETGIVSSDARPCATSFGNDTGSSPSQFF